QLAGVDERLVELLRLVGEAVRLSGCRRWRRWLGGQRPPHRLQKRRWPEGLYQAQIAARGGERRVRSRTRREEDNDDVTGSGVSLELPADGGRIHRGGRAVQQHHAWALAAGQIEHLGSVPGFEQAIGGPERGAGQHSQPGLIIRQEDRGHRASPRARRAGKEVAPRDSCAGLPGASGRARLAERWRRYTATVGKLAPQLAQTRLSLVARVPHFGQNGPVAGVALAGAATLAAEGVVLGAAAGGGVGAGCAMLAESCCGSSVVDFLNSLIPRPSALPTSGSLPAPKI